MYARARDRKKNVAFPIEIIRAVSRVLLFLRLFAKSVLIDAPTRRNDASRMCVATSREPIIQDSEHRVNSIRGIDE